jgi:protein O-GlcNAcase/histone acetyltransferase
VVEGFYGRPWSRPQREDLFDRLGASGLNTYFYAPKDDPWHRLHWFDPYPGAQARELRSLIERCQARGLRFVYGIAPGFKAEYTPQAMRRFLRRKLAQVRSLGCRDFALLFDDIPPAGSERNLRRYGSWAGAHITWTHEAAEWLETLGPLSNLLFCPTPYCGSMSGDVRQNAYLGELGQRLDPRIDIFWTGRDIIAETITVPEIRRLARVLRRPPVIWDNLFANDYDLRRIHLGPYAGRPQDLRSEVRGIVLNPNCEYEANFIALHTFASFVRARGSWSAERAYVRALAAWRLRFADREGSMPSLSEVRLLADCLHLPYQAGRGGERFLEDARTLVRGGRAERRRARRRFEPTASALAAWQSRITELRDRELSYTLYRFVWELKEEVDLLQRFVAWRDLPARRRAPFRSIFHQPGTYRGGLVARLQRLLELREDGTFAPG